MSNPQQMQKELDQLARLQQMKINSRLTALQAAQAIMSLPGFTDPIRGNEASKYDSITLIAMAQDIENYILGNIEKETEEALAAQRAKLNAPRIVRP